MQIVQIKTSSPVEALSTFIRASRDPKEDQAVMGSKENFVKNGQFLDPFSIFEL